MARKSQQEQFQIIEQLATGNQVVIRGQKLPPPAKRIVIPFSAVKIEAAEIIKLDNRENQSLTIKRINYLPTMKQIRLHTEETVFPGEYELRLTPKP